jgi:predicted phage terminase large subunit-like protein
VPNLADLPLPDLIPSISPEFSSPFHLHAWVSLLERAVSEAVRGLCDMPIRHQKTETTLHGIVHLLLKDPSRRIIFLTYSLETAQKRGKRIRQLATAAGVGPARGYDTITDWQNDKGGGVVVMSADQSKLGLDCHALIVDDPLDEFGADDPVVREAVDAAISHYTARCLRNGKRGPVLIVMSRWHPDDPIGRRLSRQTVKWEYVHQPAVIDEGQPTERAFAPDVVPLNILYEIRAELKESDPTERKWFAQLMGDPQPEGTNLFGHPTLYTELPTWAYRVGHGVDFAYVNSPGTDFYSCVSARLYGRKLYIIDVQRNRLDATLLESTCRAALDTHGRGPMWSYQAGPEVGLSKLLIQRGIPIVPMHARYNKLVRAQKAIRRWNDGDILVPETAPWRTGFEHRLSLFRGRDKDRDDEADALVSLADGLMGGAVGAPKAVGGRPAYSGMHG